MKIIKRVNFPDLSSVFKYSYIFFTLLIMSGKSLAEQNSDPANLTLKESILLSLDEHPDLQTFTHQQRMYEQLTVEAGKGEKASVELMLEDIGGSGIYQGTDSAQATLSISWIMDGAQVEKRLDSVQIEASSIEIKQKIKALDISAETSRLFIKVLVYQDRLKLTKQAERQAIETLKTIERKIKIGKSSETERLQAKVDVLNHGLMVEEIEETLRSAKYQLFAQWGGKQDSHQITGELFVRPQVDNIESSLHQVTQHPMLQLLLTQQRITESKVALAVAESQPKWKFSAGLRQHEAVQETSFVAGFSVPWGKSPKSLSEVSRYQAAQATSLSEIESMKRKLDSELFVLIQQIKHSQHEIGVIENEILPLLQEAKVVSTKAYENGKLSFREWMLSQQDLLAARQKRLTAYYNLHLQHIELQRLTGKSLYQ